MRSVITAFLIPFAKQEASLLFQLIRLRREVHSTILTTNTPFSNGRIFSGQCRDSSHSWMIDPSFQSIADYRKLLPHERLQTGTRAAFQEKNTGRFSLIDRWKKTVPRCFSAEAGEIQHRLPLKNDIFETGEKQHFWTGVDTYRIETDKSVHSIGSILGIIYLFSFLIHP